jgi:hypothetical protein
MFLVRVIGAQIRGVLGAANGAGQTSQVLLEDEIPKEDLAEVRRGLQIVN